METATQLRAAVEQNRSVDLPGRISSLLWRTVAPAVLTVTSAVAAMGGTSTAVRIVGAVFGLAMAVATLTGVTSLVRVRHIYRIRPEGLSVDGSPVVAWALIGGAFRRMDPGTDRGPKEFPVLSLTDDGLAWLRDHGTARMKLAHRPDLRGLEIPRVKGCTADETAEVLSAAIRTHRSRLGLAPVA